MLQTIVIIVAALAGLTFSTAGRANMPRNETDSTTTPVTFQLNVVPLLKSNCSPCHFEGGQVYAHYPFDDYTTVKKLGEKLNTRLKEQKQKALIAGWLKSGAREK